MAEKKDKIAVKVTHVSKDFKLPHDQQNSIKGKLINFRKQGYEVQHALKDISFEVKKGEFFGIVGRNGSGKSTLLKILAGIYNSTNGSVQVNGKLVPFIELGVGFNPELSGRDNVFLNGALLGFNHKEMAAMYDEIVEFAELERFMDQKLKNYSSGMQVRLAFSIAIRVNTDILVLDEVLAVGDEAFQRKCDDFFDKIRKDKSKTVILVTHGMDNVRKYCTRAMFIQDGVVEVIGSPEDVANQYSMMNTQVSQDSPDSIVSKGISDIKVTMLSKEIVSESDSVKLQIEYINHEKIDSKIHINLIDMNRNVPLYAGTKYITNPKSTHIKESFNIKLSEINDTNIQIAMSIRNKDGAVIAFPAKENLPKFLLRRNDYINSRDKPTYAVLFNRGEWLDEK